MTNLKRGWPDATRPAQSFALECESAGLCLVVGGRVECMQICIWHRLWEIVTHHGVFEPDFASLSHPTFLLLYMFMFGNGFNREVHDTSPWPGRRKTSSWFQRNRLWGAPRGPEFRWVSRLRISMHFLVQLSLLKADLWPWLSVWAATDVAKLNCSNEVCNCMEVGGEIFLQNMSKRFQFLLIQAFGVFYISS